MSPLGRDARLAVAARLAMGQGVAETDVLDTALRGAGGAFVAVLGETGRFSDGPEPGASSRFAVTPTAVFEVGAAGLTLLEVLPGVSARQVRQTIGVALFADERLRALET